MKKLIDTFHRVAAYGTFLSMLGMITAVTIQVAARFLLPSAPNWTEEAARIFFIYLVAFGVAVGVRDNAFVRLELLESYLSKSGRRVLHLLVQLCIFLFSCSMLIYSYRFVEIGLREESPALEINMSIVFASTFLMMISLTIMSLEQFLLLLKPENKPA